MRKTDGCAVGVRTVAHAIGCCALGLVLSSIMLVTVSAQHAALFDAPAHMLNEGEYASIAAPAIAQQGQTTPAPVNMRLPRVPLRAFSSGR